MDAEVQYFLKKNFFWVFVTNKGLDYISSRQYFTNNIVVCSVTQSSSSQVNFYQYIEEIIRDVLQSDFSGKQQ